MLLKLRRSYSFFILGWVLLCLFTTPIKSGYSLPSLDRLQIAFTINETFQLNSTQVLSYDLPFNLDQVGSHACVRVQGGIITGQTPSRLEIRTNLDGIESHQTFSKLDGLKNHYTFHSSSEYVIQIPAPIRPPLEGIQTLHMLTVKLSFIFNSAPDGTGVIHQIIFKTFTPPTLSTLDTKNIDLIQDQFSWKIGTWFFGTYFFNTSLVIPLTSRQSLNITANIDLSGLTLDGWQLSIEQGASKLQVRDNLVLQGVFDFDPELPCILHVIINPPQISEAELVRIHISVQGNILPTSQLISSKTTQSDPMTEKRFVEGLVLIQLGIVTIPLLVFYRIRRPLFKHRQKEDK
ncbi:MAG: hypothetical protein ACFFBD_01550 [Candidatus Hodarchaeota archaeon]